MQSNNFSEYSRFNILKQDPKTLRGEEMTLILPNIKDGPRSNNLFLVTKPNQIRKDSKHDFFVKNGSPLFGTLNAFGISSAVFEMVEKDVNYLSKETKVFDIRPAALKNWKEAKNNPVGICILSDNLKPKAHYIRRGSDKQLHFHSFRSKCDDSMVHTCLFFDVIAHETGHAILDIFRPDYYASQHEQTKALHESFGDLTVIFTILNIPVLRYEFFNATKGDLNQKSFFPAIAESFAEAIACQYKGLRDSTDKIRLDKIEPRNFHTISQTFTGAIYDLIDFMYRDRKNIYSSEYSDDEILNFVGRSLRRVVFQAFIQYKYEHPSLLDMALEIIRIIKNSADFEEEAKVIEKIFLERGINSQTVARLQKDYNKEIEKSEGFSICHTCH